MNTLQETEAAEYFMKLLFGLTDKKVLRRIYVSRFNGKSTAAADLCQRGDLDWVEIDAFEATSTIKALTLLYTVLPSWKGTKVVFNRRKT
jgi:hypothetical protein